MLTQVALFHDVAFTINVMRHNVISVDPNARAGALDKVNQEHAGMVEQLRALQKKKNYDKNLKMIDVSELTAEGDEEEE